MNTTQESQLPGANGTTNQPSINLAYCEADRSGERKKYLIFQST